MGPQRAIHHLLTLFALATAVTAGPACAEDEKWADWGNAPELQSPHPDSKGRSGYWWWPEYSQTLAGHTGTGNRGRIYSRWEEQAQSSITPWQDEVQSSDVPKRGKPGWESRVHYIYSDVRFAFGSTTPNHSDLNYLNIHAAAMKSGEIGNTVCIGHTDDVGSSESNERLGLRRAEAVVEYLRAAGVPAEKLSARSMGETCPVAPNDSPVDRALNRRVSLDFERISTPQD